MSLAVQVPRWNDWRWQLQNALRSQAELEAAVSLTDDERDGLRSTKDVFRVALTPYVLSTLDPDDPRCPIRRQAIPVRAEAVVSPADLEDPIGEEAHRPVPAIVHKYPDRVLLLALDHCPIYCRHCTRRRITRGGEATFDRAAIDQAVDYIRRTKAVRDVLISGGDPLLLSDARLDGLLGDLQRIDHVEMVRIGSRVPVSLPMRVTDELARTLRRHAPVYVMTHFNHPKECTDEAMAACERLVDHGVPVENQTVLLRDLNDDVDTIRTLNHKLLRHRVRPYYLHQGDLARGTEHFRTPLSRGLEIIAGLRGHTTGLAVPHFAVDLPGGGGKVTLAPNPVVAREDGVTILRSWNGRDYRYPDPGEV